MKFLSIRCQLFSCFIPLSLLLLLASGLTLSAQNVDYRILHDQPVSPRLSVNLDLFSMDMGVKNLDGTSFNIGTFGYFEPLDRISVQWNVKKSFLTLGKLGFKDYPGNLDASLGACLMLQKKTVIKPTRIVLSRKYKGSTFSTNVSGDRVETRTEEVTFISVPANRHIQRGFRGGLYFKRGAFASDNIESTSLDEMSLTSLGLYAGLTARSLKNVFVATSSHGVQFNSIGDDFALDLLFIPVNVFRDLNADKMLVSDQVKSSLGKLPVGFRLVWLRYQIAQKEQTGKRFGYAGSFEAGYKPYQGWFIGASCGITLIKK